MNEFRMFRKLPPLLLLIVGVAFAWHGTGYQIGSLTAMGAGFLPLVLGLMLACFALLLLFTPAPEAAPVPLAPLARALGCVLAGIFVWMLLAERAGFVPAALAQLLLSSLALPGIRWRTAVVAALLLTAGAWVLFVVLLGLPMRAFGG